MVVSRTDLDSVLTEEF